MNRRKFIKNTAAASAGSVVLGGLPVQVLAGNKALLNIASNSNTDRVLVFVQLHGGNDALNSVVPLNQYELYSSMREQIFLPRTGSRGLINLDGTLPADAQGGLHPDLAPFHQMYEAGKATLIHNVGYPNMNMSHFRGRDIVFMGVDGNSDLKPSGWMGRFLDVEYPGFPGEGENRYPTAEMPDPPGLELSGNLSLSYHRNVGIPIGFNTYDPVGLYNTIKNVGIPNTNFDYLPGKSHVRNELEYLMDFDISTHDYGERLNQVWDNGSNSIAYPETYPYTCPDRFKQNELSHQLRTVARLLKGGIKTRIFLCRLGGFDTHGDQVLAEDKTKGIHAALLFHLSAAIKAFHDDLAAMGLEERVLTMTFTEFGRRAYSNASYGTDHGKSTPVFLFGSGLKGGVLGTNPDLTDLDRGNTKHNIDYRQVYTSVVMDWFNASEAAVNATGFQTWKDERLDLIEGVINHSHVTQQDSGKLSIYPNPANNKTNLSLFIEKTSLVKILLLDLNGKQISTIFHGKREFGPFEFQAELSGIPKGMYVVFADVNGKRITERLVIQ